MSSAATNATATIVTRGTRNSGPGVGRRDMSPVLVTLLIDVVAFAAGAYVGDFDFSERLAFVVFGLVGQFLARNHRQRLVLSVLDDAPRLLVAVSVPGLALVLLPEFGELPPRVPEAVGAALAIIVGGRTLAYAGLRSLRRRGHLTDRAVIVGAGAVGSQLHRIFGEHPEFGIESIGLIDDVPADSSGPLIGHIRDLAEIVQRERIRQVMIAFGPRGEEDLVPVLRGVRLRDIELAIVPRFFELGLAPSGPDVEAVWGVPLYRVRRSALSRWTWPVKRGTDVLVSIAVLIVMAPLLVVLALAVKLSSPGPVLFRQRRVGQGGEQIDVFKFRSMRENQDSDVEWSVSDDPRLTRIGAFMRRTSLDELPQLFNVLRGDMSLVGPRPERPYFVDQFSEEVVGYADRHRLPVGLTGLAQIHGLRGDTSISERARFDNAYVEHWSPWLDLKVALRTLTAVVRDARIGWNADREVDFDDGAEGFEGDRPPG